ncbi:MAG TPA: ABC transporter permease [Acidimicrobiales bacterium]|nr:ABC transporter permease [Acidimicrobiales bacterium]
MKAIIPVLAIAVAVAIRVVRYRRRHAAAGAERQRRRRSGPGWLGDAGLVAGREVRERLRGKAFRIGTAIILVVVSAAIVIPVVSKGGPGHEPVGVVGTVPASTRQLLQILAKHSGLDVRIVPVQDDVAADEALRSGKIALCITGGQIRLLKAPAASDTSNSAVFVRALAQELGIERAYTDARLTPGQVEQLARAAPVPVVGLQATNKYGIVQGTSVIGVILVFIMLTQYLTWTLTGVMEEKASRVVEVLLATVRPIELLAGKVLGIGLVAMGQAVLVLGFAVALAEGVGSNLLHGTAPLELAAAGLWLLLGYAFWCWVYATAGSMVERQDQVQSLALPLSLPMLVGYITSLTVAGSGNPNLFADVLAYLPPTAPFAMPVLVGLSAVTWWEFVASALISVATTVAVARLASRLYRRAVLRTGKRVSVRELLAGLARS